MKENKTKDYFTRRRRRKKEVLGKLPEKKKGYYGLDGAGCGEGNWELKVGNWKVQKNKHGNLKVLLCCSVVVVANYMKKNKNN